MRQNPIKKLGWSVGVVATATLLSLVVALVWTQVEIGTRIKWPVVIQSEIRGPTLSEGVHVFNAPKYPNRMILCSDTGAIREIKLKKLSRCYESNMWPNSALLRCNWRQWGDARVPRVSAESNNRHRSHAIGWCLSEILEDNFGSNASVRRFQEGISNGDVCSQLSFGRISKIGALRNHFVALQPHNYQNAGVNQAYAYGSEHHRPIGFRSVWIIGAMVLLFIGAMSIACLGWWLMLTGRGYRNPWAWLTLCCGACALGVWAYYLWSFG